MAKNEAKLLVKTILVAVIFAAIWFFLFGQQPKDRWTSPNFLIITGFVCLFIFAAAMALLVFVLSLAAEWRLAAKRRQADEFLAGHRYTEAIRTWKDVLSRAREEDVADVLPKFSDVYKRLGNQAGLQQLQGLAELYADLFSAIQRVSGDKSILATCKSLRKRIATNVAQLPD